MLKEKIFSKLNLNKISRKPLKIILLIIFIIVIFILVFPLWPIIPSLLSHHDPNKVYYPITSEIKNLKIAEVDQLKPIPEENRLVIPKINVDSEILEGDSLDILSQREGVWRESKNQNPEILGNMVIAGHRFQYLPPNTSTFYNLERITVGDYIIVFWNKKTYIYEVYSTDTVTPDKVEVRNNNPDIPHEITIYTCTPLYTSEKRYIVKAKLI